MFASLTNWPFYGGLNSCLISEAVYVINGGHIGLNSQLGGILKRSHGLKWFSRSETNKGLNDHFFKELGLTDVNFKAILNSNRPLECSSSVKDILRTCGVRNLRNPYSLVHKRNFSTFNFLTLRPSVNSIVKVNPTLLSTRFSSDISSFKLNQLETRANDETDNACVQTEYLQAVYKQDPEYVVQRIESGRYAINTDVREVYMKALSLVMDQSTTSTSSGSLGQLNAIGAGSKTNPVHVVMQPRKGSFIRELWDIAKLLIMLLIALTFISSAIFSQFKGTTQQFTKDFRPDVGEQKHSFEDVQGIDEAKDQVQEIVEFLRNPEKFKKLGAKLPTGALLIGPPGTGKTLLAKAIAGEADVPFFFASGSEFDEMFVGVGAARIRKLFEQARRHKPCVVFIDELDAVGGARVASAVHPYSRMTLNQLLVELDGYKELEGVVVVGATNFPESLDKALIRPGRFDNQIHLHMPDVRARLNILKVHANKVKLAPEVDLEKVARGTGGFSGADLANLVNQAAIRGSSLGHDGVTNSDLDYARDKILMGPERRNAVITQKNKELIAYHEGGHALVAIYTKDALPIHKATIIPRGPALGMVSYLPEKDELSWSKQQYLAQLDIAMGGRVAEELVFGVDNITSGASSDLQKATVIARSMVTKFGMSDAVGPMTFDKDDKISSDTQKGIDDEIRRLLKESHSRAQSILKSRAIEHKRLAEALLKYETLDESEINIVIAGKKLNRKV